MLAFKVNTKPKRSKIRNLFFFSTQQLNNRVKRTHTVDGYTLVTDMMLAGITSLIKKVALPVLPVVTWGRGAYGDSNT